MKTSKLKNIAWVCFALTITSSTTFGQGWRNGNRANVNTYGICLQNISGLSEKQQDQIQEMADKHNKEMEELREKRRTTNDAIRKSEIRTAMLKNTEAQRNSVKKILTAEQQTQFEQLFSGRNSKGCDMQFVWRNGSGNNRGKQRFAQRNKRDCINQARERYTRTPRFNRNKNRSNTIN